ncbi:MAG TPA: ABC transporter permease [Gemmatimonadaceae bacterium]|nr:ABC transporter permease [Gemmatimonadaceae bacterium]
MRLRELSFHRLHDAGVPQIPGQRALVVVQVAAALVLLASAAIVYNAFRRVLAVNLGFDASGLTVVSADYWEPRLDSAGAIAYQREWLRRAAEEPGIAAVAVSSVIPPAAWARARWVFRGGEELPPGTRLGDSPAGGMRTYLDIVSPGFFDVMKLPINMGRGLLESDDDRGERVVVVSRRLAEIAWPNENPLGKMLSLRATEEKRLPAMRVIAVAGDVRFASIFDDAPAVAYLPAVQHPGETHSFVVRSRDGGDVPDATIRRIGTATDARVPISTTSITGEIDEQLGP